MTSSPIASPLPSEFLILVGDYLFTEKQLNCRLMIVLQYLYNWFEFDHCKFVGFGIMKFFYKSMQNIPCDF